MKKIIVIGCGAAGMIASLAAVRKGARVLVLERMQRVGKKLLATGNGRCNLTNMNLDSSKYHGSAKFSQSVMQQFDVSKTLAFFEELGIVVRVEDEGRVFPLCDQASSVLDVLRYEMDRSGIKIICESKVQKLTPTDDGLECFCIDKEVHKAERVIVATGGNSSPNLGSNGGGFGLAAVLGHSVIEPFPALVPVKLDSPYLKRLQGVKTEAEAEVSVDGIPERTDRGEILFTEFGLSGPPILHLSRVVSQNEKTDKAVQIRLDLFPELSENDLAGLISKRFKTSPEKTLEFSFVGLIHKRIIPVILIEAGFEDTSLPCSSLTTNEIRRIASQLKRWCLRCAGTQSWMFSQVTGGGVDSRQVDRRTLESKVVPGVFFAGEVLDVDGDSGGFNLQWAWSSGYVAGVHAAT